MFDKQKKIGALIKTGLVDFPERVAATLFLHGCNLRCPYCQNVELVSGSFSDYDAVAYQDVLNHLEKRKDVLTGFVLSGGEPLLFPYLEELIADARSLGYKIKLDTNGMLPKQLEKLLNTHTIDYVALDIKTSPERYTEMYNTNSTLLPIAQRAGEHICESIKIVSSLPTSKREFRTVLVPPLVTKSEIQTLAQLLPEDASWYFAQFSNIRCVSEDYNRITPYTKEQLEELVTYAQTFIKRAELR